MILQELVGQIKAKTNTRVELPEFIIEYLDEIRCFCHLRGFPLSRSGVVGYIISTMDKISVVPQLYNQMLHCSNEKVTITLGPVVIKRIRKLAGITNTDERMPMPQIITSLIYGYYLTVVVPQIRDNLTEYKRFRDYCNE